MKNYFGTKYFFGIEVKFGKNFNAYATRSQERVYFDALT